jgi:hypothetical protein
MSSLADVGTIGQGLVAIGMVERALTWLAGCQELQVRQERRADLLRDLLLGVCADLPQCAAPAKGGPQEVACVKG